MMSDNFGESDDEDKVPSNKLPGGGDTAADKGAEKNPGSTGTSGSPTPRPPPTYTLEVGLASARKIFLVVRSGGGDEVSRDEKPKAHLEDELKKLVVKFTDSFKNSAKKASAAYPARMQLDEANRTPYLHQLIEAHASKPPSHDGVNENVPVRVGKSTKTSLGEALKTLTKLGEVKPTGKGHPKIQMRSYELESPVSLNLGGKVVEMTHLYTQMGNRTRDKSTTELRLYLGTKAGAVQRVHTSVTMQGADTTAHTMVQTGTDVVVPYGDEFVRKNQKSKEKPPRVGYDVTHLATGLSSGTVSSRNNDSVSSKGRFAVPTLKGEEAEAAAWLRDHFHKALDSALSRLPKPEKAKPTLYGTDSKVLDWDLEAAAGMSPLLHHYRMRRKKSVDAEEVPISPPPSSSLEPISPDADEKSSSIQPVPPLGNAPTDTPDVSQQGDAPPQHADLRASPDAGLLDRPGRELGAMAAELEQLIDRMEQRRPDRREQADTLRKKMRASVDALIEDLIAQIARNPALVEAVMDDGISRMEQLSSAISEQL